MAFTDLPKDLHLIILDLLSAKDAAVLLRVCRCLHALSGNRSLWILQLRRLISCHELDASSFDLASMSTADIRDAATQPHKFERQILLGDSSTTPRVIRSSGVMTGERVDDVQLIPGGRWVVTVSTPPDPDLQPSPYNLLRIWDLHNLEEGKAPVPFACERINRWWDRCGSVALRVDRHNRTLLFVCSALNVSPSDSQYDVFRFDGSSTESPLVRLISESRTIPWPVAATARIISQGRYVVFEPSEPTRLLVLDRRIRKMAMYALGSQDIPCNIAVVRVSEEGIITVWDVDALSITLYGPLNVKDVHEATVPPTLSVMAQYTLDPTDAPDIGRFTSFMVDHPGSPYRPRAAIAKYTGGLLPLDISQDVIASGNMEIVPYQFKTLHDPFLARRTISGHLATLARSFLGTELLVLRSDGCTSWELPQAIKPGRLGHFMCTATGLLGGLTTHGQFVIWKA